MRNKISTKIKITWANWRSEDCFFFFFKLGWIPVKVKKEPSCMLTPVSLPRLCSLTLVCTSSTLWLLRWPWNTCRLLLSEYPGRIYLRLPDSKATASPGVAVADWCPCFVSISEELKGRAGVPKPSLWLTSAILSRHSFPYDCQPQSLFTGLRRNADGIQIYCADLKNTNKKVPFAHSRCFNYSNTLPLIAHHYWWL